MTDNKALRQILVSMINILEDRDFLELEKSKSERMGGYANFAYTDRHDQSKISFEVNEVVKNYEKKKNAIYQKYNQLRELLDCINQ